MKIESAIPISSVSTQPAQPGNQESIAKIQGLGNREGEKYDFNDNILNKSIEQANKELKSVNRSIERHIHEKTKTIIYRIVDANTKEIIKEFPPEKIQDMIAKLWELVGLFVDEKA